MQNETKAETVARVARAMDADPDTPDNWADLIDQTALFRWKKDPERFGYDNCIMQQVYGEYSDKADELIGWKHGQDRPLNESPFWPQFTNNDGAALCALWAVEIDARTATTTAQEAGA